MCKLKKIGIVILFVFNSLLVISQDQLSTKDKKYFVAIGYGVGNANWFSQLKNADLYDKNGLIIKQGDISFKAKNAVSLLNLETSFPILKVRLGMGISFEKFQLDKIVLSATANNPESNNLIFDESFNFDKFYAFIEIPFNAKTEKPYSFSAKANVGYYAHNGITRFNFFGEEPIASTYLLNLGFLADYKLFPHAYLYINPSYEYKYFRNNKLESPSTIKHNIFSYTIVGGIRVDVSRE